MVDKIQLGETAAYPDTYDAGLLEPIPRKLARNKLACREYLEPMQGTDIWHAYELSWLEPSGKPRVAQAEFQFDCHSPAIVESKSFKYFLNSCNQTVFDSEASLRHKLGEDLAAACGAQVKVHLHPVGSSAHIQALPGLCVDALEAENYCYTPDKQLLAMGPGQASHQCLYSHLLKSNCPVTGQPDWATLWIEYSGQEIRPESFLRYVVSFRQHQDYHENCVEKVYCDVMSVCQPEKLQVYARYTRRGGARYQPVSLNPRRRATKKFSC